jgi:hypothetical protein
MQPIHSHKLSPAKQPNPRLRGRVAEFQNLTVLFRPWSDQTTSTSKSKHPITRTDNLSSGRRAHRPARERDRRDDPGVKRPTRFECGTLLGQTGTCGVIGASITYCQPPSGGDMLVAQRTCAGPASQRKPDLRARSSRWRLPTGLVYDQSIQRHSQ